MTDDIESGAREPGEGLNPQDDSALSKAASPKGKVILAKKGEVVTSESQMARDVDFSKSPSAVLEEELQIVRNEAKENYDKYLRALAELENFKKRSAKERSDLIKYQGEKIFVDLLDIVDDFERAMQFANADIGHFKSGVELIHKRLLDVLSKWEIRGETGVGKSFDPNIHHAISKVPATADTAAGTIVGELKKVFFYRDKVLRHGEVVVASDPE